MKRHSITYYQDGLKNGNPVVLAQAITLIESSRTSDQLLSNQLLDSLVHIPTTFLTLRIGITGTPGVGKSSFIEAFGSYLIIQGKKVAVLAIDPSSQKTGGSILGDKTRMATLSMNAKAYIRPSASGRALGGVNNKTKEAILLCEATGFDVIIVETVGVGQSETLVHSMVDFFLLMIQPGAGDDLQGIKKGIMEMADGVVINKADGDQQKLAKRAKADLLNALHLYTPHLMGWETQVNLCSSIEKRGLEKVWSMIQAYQSMMMENKWFEKNRVNQNVSWFERRVDFEMMRWISNRKEIIDVRQTMIEKIQTNELSITSAAREMVQLFAEVISKKK